MNTKYYDEICKLFEEYHPHMASNVVDYRPKSNIAIRLTMNDGTQYDFDKLSKGITRVKETRKLVKDDITDEQCRKSFAYHLREQMGFKGYNQHTLAEFTNISVGSINAYLKEDKTPSITNLRKIAYALDCSIIELLD